MRKIESCLLDGYVLYGINTKNRYSPVGVVAEDGRRKAKCDLSTIPKSLVEKLIKIEDIRFYKHFGIDMKAIGRATLENISILLANPFIFYSIVQHNFAAAVLL